MKSLKGKARDEALSKQEKHIKRIRRLLDTYMCSIQSGAFGNAQATHKSQFKEFELEINRLEKTMESNRHDLGTEE